MIKLSKKITVWITAHPFLTLLIVFIFSLTFPIFLFNCLRNLSISDQTINSSDILSYNGAIFGGLVTVVSIIYTFNYESKKSAEELRRNSLPILKLSFIKENNLFKYDVQICKNSEFKASYEKKKELLDCINQLEQEKNNLINIYNRGPKEGKYPDNYDLNKETKILRNNLSDLESKQDNYHKELKELDVIKVVQYGLLKISNIGLQTAILSAIKIQPVHDRSVKITELININSVTVLKDSDSELKICFVTYDKENKEYTDEYQLELVFTDLYLNQYYYTIPLIHTHKKDADNLVLKSKSISILPKRLE